MMNALIRTIPVLVLLVILCYFVNNLFKSFTYFKKRRVFRLFTTIMFTIIIYFSFIYIFFSNIITFDKVVFDSEKWKKNIEIRFKMVDNIIESNMLINKEKNEIKEIIGLPNDKSNNENIWSYEIIKKSWGGLTFDNLNIYFEDNSVSLIKLE